MKSTPTAVNNFVQIKAEQKAKAGFQGMDENLLIGTIVSMGSDIGREFTYESGVSVMKSEVEVGDKVLFSILKHFIFPIDGINYYWVEAKAIVHKF